MISLQSENGGEKLEVGGAGGGAEEGEDEILAELQRKQAELKAVVSCTTVCKHYHIHVDENFQWRNIHRFHGLTFHDSFLHEMVTPSKVSC